MATEKKNDILSAEEKAAMRATVKERKRQAKLSPEEARAAGEADVLAAIGEMPDEDAAIATRIHEIVGSVAPQLVPRTFYGMPAYARDGKVVVFFQSKAKFKVRYSTLGFQPDAKLDDDTMWPTGFAITAWSSANEKRITDLVKKAAG